MNLPCPENHFEYKGWLVDMVFSSKGSAVQGYATLKMDGKYKSTLRLLPSPISETAARFLLSAKAKEFVDEWAH
ncbi:MAG: hypothetical protein EOP24_47685 [Hyphomicrobiales bacterium]|nr:MAG: hypothetical protein EOP24_47685 [Hyphomicrobiales bacterium]